MKRIGTQLTAPAVIQDDTIPSSGGFSNLNAGGLFHFETLADLLALPDYYKFDTYYEGQSDPLWGIVGIVHSDTTPGNNGEWELKKGHSSNDITDNGNWKKKTQGTIFATDVTETTDRVFITEAERNELRKWKGRHLTEAALNAAFPTADPGSYAINEDTDTVWVWDNDTSSWVNSGASSSSLYIHPDHTGDVTSDGDGATTITPKAVTNPKLADMAANTIKGVITSGQPQDLTPTQARTILNVADGANNYTHPNHGASGNGDATSNADGDITIRNEAITFAKISPSAIAADNESSATKLVKANDPRLGGLQSIGDNTVTNAKLSDMAANRIKGAVSAGDPVDLNRAQALAILNVQEGATDDQTGDEIKTALETLTGEDRLDASAIKNLTGLTPEQEAIIDSVGDKDTLNTTSKIIVGAINELLAVIGGLNNLAVEDIDTLAELNAILNDADVASQTFVTALTNALETNKKDKYITVPTSFAAGQCIDKVGSTWMLASGTIEPFFLVVEEGKAVTLGSTYDLGLPLGDDGKGIYYWNETDQELTLTKPTEGVVRVAYKQATGLGVFVWDNGYEIAEEVEVPAISAETYLPGEITVT